MILLVLDFRNTFNLFSLYQLFCYFSYCLVAAVLAFTCSLATYINFHICSATFSFKFLFCKL